MDAQTAFADACRSWRDLIDRAAQLEAAERLEALAAHLVHLYAAGLRLPATDAPAGEPPAPSPWPEDWPGLGPLDERRPPLTLLLQGVTSDVTRGLAWSDDAASAAGWWRSTFDARWGTLAIASMEQLHHAVVTLRSGAPEPPADRVDDAPTDPGEVAAPQPGGLLSFEPAPPERRPSGRVRARSDEMRGVLGVRFEPSAEGLRVTAVHPAGPAAGVLTPGDLLVAVDGLPLGGRSTTEAGAALAGPAGRPRTFQVARGSGLVEVHITGVTAESLADAPLSLRLLVLDRDAASAILPTLADLDVSVHADAEQEGLVDLQVPARSRPAVQAILAEGQDQGWWDLLGR